MVARLDKRPADSVSGLPVASQTWRISRRRRKSGNALLSLVCAVCLVLSLVCTCLATYAVVLEQRIKALSSDDESRKFRGLETMEDNSDVGFRLPSDVKPVHYDIYLHPDLLAGTFKGNVSILLNVENERSFIALHQKDLNITSGILRTYDREENYEIPVEQPEVLAKREMLIVRAKNYLHPGLYTLDFEFNGALRPEKIVGFYSSKYADSKNKTRYIATSKFEPTYARRAFPCFDEPAFKAEFSVKLVHPSGDCYSALSNMNVESSKPNEPGPGLTTVTFAKSVPMSTYLSCFIVSDFVAVTKMAKGLKGKEFPVSVYTTQEQKEKGLFALDIGVKIIEYYIDLFKIDYPLPKLDMAAIPDFVSGAMENWGLVTYREARLLYDKNITSTANKYEIVLVISHEFAHMWFGNLVTMAWWNDLWLNEGFASFMQYKSADAILPDWGMMDRFLISQMHEVFVTDAKLSSHPIVQTVSSPDEITSIFDEISYKKGSSVLRMLENFIGPEIFYSAITAYLKRFEYGNAETADLFGIIQDAVGGEIDVTSVMDTWTRQKGFPVVKVEKSGNSYTLTQKRFLADPRAEYDPMESPYRYKWTIPVTYVTNRTSKPTLVWFDRNSENVVISLDESVDWIKFNADQVGYYRVNYQPEVWDELTNVLRWYHKRLSVADRTSLLEDAFSLASAEEIDYSVPLNMTAYLPRENHAIPWAVAATKLSTLDTLLQSTKVSKKFRDYVRNLVDSVYHDVTWMVDESEDHVTRRFRTTVLELACSVEHVECLEEVGQIFKAWINDKKDIRPHPDIRSLVYRYGMYSVGGEEEWNVMYERFSKENDASEKLKLMRGLAGIRSTWILGRLIDTGVEAVRAQDFFGLLQSISSNPIGSSLVWDWVRSHWEFLVERYTLNDRYLGQLIPAISGSFASEEKLNEMTSFFAKYPNAGAGASSRAKALETLNNNIKWLQKHSSKIDKWFDEHVKKQ